MFEETLKPLNVVTNLVGTNLCRLNALIIKAYHKRHMKSQRQNCVPFNPEIILLQTRETENL